MVKSLSIHADYRCGRSGACCSSAWPIPVDASLVRVLAAALDEGRLGIPGAMPGVGPGRTGFLQEATADGDEAGILRQTGEGRCVFYADSQGRCAIQQALGHDVLPRSCQFFPRVALRDGRGTHISLSHYCPTAARLLLRTDVPLAVIDGPAAFPAGTYEGLEATADWPPLLRPGVLMDLDAYGRWEAGVVDCLGQPGIGPEAALLALGAAAETVRAWRSGRGPLAPLVAAALSGAAASARTTVPSLTPRAAIARYRDVLSAVPADLATSAWTPGFAGAEEADARWVAPVWSRFAGPICRYLAARGFASWLAYQGHGLRTLVRGLWTALGVVRAAAIAGVQAARRPLDEALMLEAFRAADLLLVHLASRQALADGLSRAERC